MYITSLQEADSPVCLNFYNLEMFPTSKPSSFWHVNTKEDSEPVSPAPYEFNLGI